MSFLHPGQETAQVQIADVFLLPVLLVVRKDPVHMEFGSGMVPPEKVDVGRSDDQAGSAAKDVLQRSDPMGNAVKADAGMTLGSARPCLGEPGRTC